MALVNCPECSARISDRALLCPHCGYPIATPESANTKGNKVYTKLSFDGHTINIEGALQSLHDDHDWLTAKCRLYDAFDDIGQNYHPKNDMRLFQMVEDNYEKFYGEKCTLLTDREKAKPKCPTCGSTNIEKISTIARGMSLGMFGLASKTARSQFMCKNCGYKW